MIFYEHGTFVNKMIFRKQTIKFLILLIKLFNKIKSIRLWGWVFFSHTKLIKLDEFEKFSFTWQRGWSFSSSISIVRKIYIIWKGLCVLCMKWLLDWTKRKYDKVLIPFFSSVCSTCIGFLIVYIELVNC